MKVEKKHQGHQGKVPPQAPEMEQAVLGALMLEKDALPKVIDFLRAESFYHPQNRLIFEAMVKLFQESQPIDLLTVKNKLQVMGRLEEVGGVFYLTGLTSKVATSANIEYHSRIISQKFLMRELIRISGETLVMAYDETCDVFELMDHTEHGLFDLTETNLRRRYQSMTDLVMASVKKMEDVQGCEGGVTGVATGYNELDQLTSGFHDSDLVIVAARPAMGKTAFTLTMARNMSVRYKVPVAFFSLEMDASQLVQRLMCAEAEVDLQRARNGQLTQHDWQRITEKVGTMASAPIYIDDTPAVTLMELRAKARRLKSEKNIGMIIIDYLQLMSGDNLRSGQSNREQEIASISRGLKELAKELHIPVLALSQLSRAVETRGGDKRPMLSDLRESGSIEQDADTVMFLYRPEYYGLTTEEDGSSTENLCEVIIAKQRSGPVGSIRLYFEKRFVKFRNFGDGAEKTHGDVQLAQIKLPAIQPSTILGQVGSTTPKSEFPF